MRIKKSSTLTIGFFQQEARGSLVFLKKKKSSVVG
jgi:hypothetical protein